MYKLSLTDSFADFVDFCQMRESFWNPLSVKVYVREIFQNGSSVKLMSTKNSKTGYPQSFYGHGKKTKSFVKQSNPI